MGAPIASIVAMSIKTMAVVLFIANGHDGPPDLIWLARPQRNYFLRRLAEL
jgi:hypothetical protein